MSEVWVNGVGAVTPLGHDWARTRDALAAGKCAIRPVRAFDAGGFPSRHAAVIEEQFPGEDRRTALALRAAREAWTQAAPGAGVVGVFIGAESGRPRFETFAALARAGGPASIDSGGFSPSAVAARLAAELNANGPVATISLACASGAAAIAEAARAVSLGECDVALAGGVGADVDPLMLAGFGLLGALSQSGISRPFDRNRDGFVLGEGAAMVVISSSKGLARVKGFGRTLDASSLTAPAPDGDGAIRSMRLALAAAGLKAVDVVQAHGTSTPLNDAVEARAIRAATGSALVSSVKGALGHGIAAAGAIGFIAAIEAIASGIVFPTVGLEAPDFDLRLVAGRALTGRFDSAMVNSFAFGGANCSLVVTRA